MGNIYKVVITGPFGVGKTEFVRSISDIPIVMTEKRITNELAAVKEETTVAMDYGQVRIGDDLFHLYGTPGQPRFEFMWDILAKEMDGFVLLVDSCDLNSFMQARQLLRVFQRKTDVPYLIAANKQDQLTAMSLEEIRKRLGLTPEIPVISCIAIDKASVRNVMEELQAILR
ncbi:MAG TPA: GTP-binding protein [Chloroflexi bacterium]|nr:GTP-binding protein [Chloroflexota bacterium]